MFVHQFIQPHAAVAGDAQFVDQHFHNGQQPLAWHVSIVEQEYRAGLQLGEQTSGDLLWRIIAPIQCARRVAGQFQSQFIYDAKNAGIGQSNRGTKENRRAPGKAMNFGLGADNILA
jgi:hypothetical protein